MLQILNITAPIYLLIAAGFLAVRLGLFKKDDMRLLGRLLVLCILPALVFRAISRYSIDQVLNLHFLAVYGLGSAVVMVAGVLYSLRLRRQGAPQAAFIGMGMAASNSVFVGYPIASQLIGSSADIALALCLLVENLLIIPATLVMASANPSLPWYQALAHSLKALLRNPIFLAIVAGFGFALLGLPLPSVLDRTLGLAAGAAAPLALFMIGGVLVGQSLEGVRLDMAAVSIGKLLLHPAAMLLLLAVLPAGDAKLATAAVLFAAMPMPAIFPALAQRFGLDGWCSTVLIVVTIVSFFTLNAWLWGLTRFMPALLP